MQDETAPSLVEYTSSLTLRVGIGFRQLFRRSCRSYRVHLLADASGWYWIQATYLEVVQILLGSGGEGASSSSEGWISNFDTKFIGRKVMAGETSGGLSVDADKIVSPASASENVGDLSADEGPIRALMRLARRSRFFRSGDGRLFAQVAIGSRREIHSVKSTVFRDWLISGYFADRRELPSDWAVRRVLSALESFARFDEKTPSVFIRVGRDESGNDSEYYVDLGDASGRAFQIGAEGWAVVDRPGVAFRRPDGLVALPTPSHDGSIELLRPFVNLDEPDFRLFLTWLAAAMRPVGPYPILVVYGEQGSAKSTLSRLANLLIDPQTAPLLAEPRSTRDLMVTAVNGWLLAFDNISAVPGWLSDGLCRVATGGGFASRALYSNDERCLIQAQRPIILNGIEEFVSKGDLAERSIVLNLPSIPRINRRSEQEFWRSFRAQYPRILGGLLDAIVGGIRELPSVRLPELPRMADYACFGAAVGRGLGWPDGTFLSAYEGNRQNTSSTLIDDSVLAKVLLRMYTSEFDGYTCTVDGMRSELMRFGAKALARNPGWPKTNAKFGSELRRLAPELRAHGLSLTFSRTRGARLVTVSSSGCAEHSAVTL